MISENDLYKVIGLAVVVLFVVSIGVKMFRFQTKIVEGMTNGANSTDIDKRAAAIDSKTDANDTTLALHKNRSAYEDMIVALEKNCSEYILLSISDNAEAIANNPTSDENQKIITSLNNLVQFRSTLNTAMTILDKK
uniref:Uncharacterized protein n=1 Tax=viral metagenome TaxID=1070528 RepID=A0A6C0CNP3_9ZZZZ